MRVTRRPRCTKLLNLRLWDDESQRSWARNVMQIGGEVLLGACARARLTQAELPLTLRCAGGWAVSQFTLQAVLKGHKPDYHMAMKAAESRAFYDAFVGSVRQAYKPDAIKGATRARLAAGV